MAYRNKKKRSKIIRLATHGPYEKNIFTLEDIGNQRGVKVCKQRISQVLKNEKIDFLSIIEKAKEQKSKDLQNLVDSLANLMYSKAQQTSWAYEKATEAWFKTQNRSNGHSLEQYIKLFEAYETAEKQGIKLSLQDFQELTDIWFTGVGKLFEKVNVQPMHGTREINHISKEEREAISRAYDLKNFSSRDIGYFLSVNYWIVNQKWQKKGVKKIIMVE